MEKKLNTNNGKNWARNRLDLQLQLITWTIRNRDRDEDNTEQLPWGNIRCDHFIIAYTFDYFFPQKETDKGRNRWTRKENEKGEKKKERK